MEKFTESRARAINGILSQLTVSTQSVCGATYYVPDQTPHYWYVSESGKALYSDFAIIQDHQLEELQTFCKMHGMKYKIVIHDIKLMRIYISDYD